MAPTEIEGEVLKLLGDSPLDVLPDHLVASSLKLCARYLLETPLALLEEAGHCLNQHRNLLFLLLLRVVAEAWEQVLSREGI